MQKSNTPPWVFFLVFKIVQMVPNRAKNHILSEWVNHIFWYLYQWKVYCLGLTMMLYWKTSHNLCSNNHLKYMWHLKCYKRRVYFSTSSFTCQSQQCWHAMYKICRLHMQIWYFHCRLWASKYQLRTRINNNFLSLKHI